MLKISFMRDLLLKTSRTVFGWPPRPASTAEKHALVTNHAKKWRVKNLIETGTFEGDMVEAQWQFFERIVSVELDEKLAAAAAIRFKNRPQIQIFQGDSAMKLAEAMRLIDSPALFWLDAHYSRGVTAHGDLETPIMKELALIAGQRPTGDLILIDDARLFGLRRSYPKLNTVKKFAEQYWPRYSFQIVSDAICITPPLP
jgi:hypothetical protein